MKYMWISMLLSITVYAAENNLFIEDVSGSFAINGVAGKAICLLFLPRQGNKPLVTRYGVKPQGEEIGLLRAAEDQMNQTQVQKFVFMSSGAHIKNEEIDSMIRKCAEHSRESYVTVICRSDETLSVDDGALVML